MKKLSQYPKLIASLFTMAFFINASAQENFVDLNGITINTGSSEIYEAYLDIMASETSSFVIEGDGTTGGTVSMTAGNCITWKPGFHAKEGSEVNAKIDAVMAQLAASYVVDLDAGSANVTATGGTPPYSYLWSTGATTANVSGLDAGTYTLEVTDNAGLVLIERISIFYKDLNISKDQN